MPGSKRRLMSLLVCLVGISSAVVAAQASQSVAAPATQPGHVSSWVAWSQQEDAQMRSTDFEALTQHLLGCTPISPVTYSRQALTAGIPGGPPAGTLVTGASVVFQCPVAASMRTHGATASANAVVSPDVDNCATIEGPGGACVGVTPHGYQFAKYTYKGAYATYGHVELGMAPIGVCEPGTAVSNGPEVTLSAPGQGEITYAHLTVNGNWSSTWWNRVAGADYSWGTVCGEY